MRLLGVEEAALPLQSHCCRCSYLAWSGVAITALQSHLASVRIHGVLPADALGMGVHLERPGFVQSRSRIQEYKL